MDRPGRKLKIGILASTNMTDGQAVIDAIKTRKLNAEITVVISDKEKSGALKRTEKHQIPAAFISPKGRTREEFDELVDRKLEVHGADLVLLIGYMRILSADFIKKWQDKTMNIHPALLPMFAGGMDLDVHRAILKRGAKITGATLMFIDDGADTGPIILEAGVIVEFDDTEDTLKARVQATEQTLILKGIQLFMDGKLKIEKNAYGGKYVKVLE